MSEDIPKSSLTDTNEGEVKSFTEAQRAEFWSAGLWMGIVGWMELAAGSVLCAIWVLSLRNVSFGQIKFSNVLEMSTIGIEIGGAIGIGLSTVWTASSLRRISKRTERTTEAVMEAISRLRHLYTGQVILFAVLISVTLLTRLRG